VTVWTVLRLALKHICLRRAEDTLPHLISAHEQFFWNVALYKFLCIIIIIINQVSIQLRSQSSDRPLFPILLTNWLFYDYIQSCNPCTGRLVLFVIIFLSFLESDGTG
jgi:hypothetical protein